MLCPIPGIDGGAKKFKSANEKEANSFSKAAVIPSIESFLVVRFAQSCNPITAKATFSPPPPKRLYPATVITYFIPSMARILSLISLRTSLVWLMLAVLSNWTLAKIIPWSSSGKKDVAVIWKEKTINTIAPKMAISVSNKYRAKNPTTLT